jgi:glycosyltransferase involved in cell wall biosynthesis
MSNKVYVLAPKENWIVDRFVKEWYEDNADISVVNPNDADVIWLLADWAWKHMVFQHGTFLTGRKVITSVHHITPEKFGPAEQADFAARDQFTDVYHVYNERTAEFIKPLTSKPVELIYYWANQKIFFPSGRKKSQIRSDLGVPTDAYVIGSFQRDTEGHDLISPKLEKGPDIFVDSVLKYRQTNPDVHVLLGGWRRQYVISRLESEGVPYTYLEMQPQETIRDMYEALDLYVVSARHEGGPQALIECGLMNVPCVSTPVGIAEQVLPVEAINLDPTKATPTIPNTEPWGLPAGYEPYRKLIQSL